MATFFFDQKVGYWVSVDLRGSLYGDIRRSGNTVYLENMTFDMYPTGPAYGTDNFTLTVNGTPTTWTVQAGTLPIGTTVNSTSFAVSNSQTSANVAWSTSDGENGTFTVTFPSGVTAPTGLNVTNIIKGTRSFTGTVSVTSWGGTGDANSRYLELQAWEGNMTGNRRYQPVYGNSLSQTITVNNSSRGAANLTPNTQYTIGGYASNGMYDTGSQKFATLITLPEAAIVSFDISTGDSATFDYTTGEDGGALTKYIEYSLDNGSTWQTGATVNSSSAVSGTFEVNGLTAGQTYTILTRTRTTSGSSAGESITFIAGAVNRFGSVNGETRRSVKRYGSVNGETKLIIKRYGSVEGVTKLV